MFRNLIAVAILSLWQPGVWAHALLERAEPAPGSVSAVIPTEIRLAFDSALEHAFCAVRVEDPSGGVVATGDIDGMHVASTAVWVGGLLVLATSARPLFLTGHDRAYALETAERLSRVAGLALLCVVPTGIYNAVTQIGYLSALWETAYGRLLLLKLAGVLGMVGLGAINRFRGLPALQDWAQGSPISRHTPSGGERFLRIATVESLLAVWVLGCTALLTGASPPRQGSPGAMHHAAAAEVSTALVEIAAYRRTTVVRSAGVASRDRRR